MFITMLSEIQQAVLSEDSFGLNNLLVNVKQSDLNTALIGSILLSNNINIIETLLNAGADVNYQDNYGRTALFLAVKYNRKTIIQFMIQRGSNIHLSKCNDSSVLHLASKKGDVEIIQMLLHAGHVVNTRNWGGNTALIIASKFGNIGAVKKLIQYGAEVNDCNKLGHSALHYACYEGSIELVETLLKHGGDPDARTYLGISPIMLACEQDHCKIVKMLCYRSNLKKPEKLYGAPALHWAVATGCVNCVRCIIDEECSVYTNDGSNRSPLIQAIQSDKPEVLKFLLGKYDNADFLHGSNNCTVLHLASLLGRQECVKVLIKNPKTLHLYKLRDIFNDLPYDLALRQNHHQVADILKYIYFTEIGNTKDVIMANEKYVDYTSLKKNENEIFVPVFKTYSPVKMTMIGLLQKVNVEQMVAQTKFDFNTWLDNGPEAFVLKVIGLDITDWLYYTMHNPWSLRELCRGQLRFQLGYRANEKIELLPIPNILKKFLKLKELEDIGISDIKIQNTSSYENIEIE